jgi:hypothetical protein
MDAASRVVLDGFVLKTDVQIIQPGERYQDDDGKRLWELVQNTLHDILVASGQLTRELAHSKAPLPVEHNVVGVDCA